MSEINKIPKHVAIIMDGNGRWAQQRGKERFEGHIQGVESLRNTIKAANNFGVSYLTFYAFSTENWGRPTEEVDSIMELICKSVAHETPELAAQGVRVKVIGDKSRFSAKVQESLQDIEGRTAEGDKLTMILALNYSSRDEIRRAVSRLAERVERGELRSDEITEEAIAAELDTAAFPDPDLLIRTSGENRLSNFLLWQLSYAEFYFPDVLWPDFDQDEFRKALEIYSARDRRFGLVK